MLDRYGNHSRSKRSRSNVAPKYASARRFFARLASEIFLISLQKAFFNNVLAWCRNHVHHNWLTLLHYLDGLVERRAKVIWLRNRAEALHT